MTLNTVEAFQKVWYEAKGYVSSELWRLLGELEPGYYHRQVNEQFFVALAKVWDNQPEITFNCRVSTTSGLYPMLHKFGVILSTNYLRTRLSSSFCL